MKYPPRTTEHMDTPWPNLQDRSLRFPFMAAFKLRGVEVAHAGVLEGIEGSALVAAKHQSMLDVPPLAHAIRIMGMSPHFWPKKELDIPVLGPYIKACGGLFIDRAKTAKELAEKVEPRIAGNAMFATFPEGTRTPGSGIGRLKVGPVAVAMKYGLPIIPAGIAGTVIEEQVPLPAGRQELARTLPRTLWHGALALREFCRTGPAVVSFGEPIDIGQRDLDLDPRELVRVRRTVLDPALAQLREGMEAAQAEADAIYVDVQHDVLEGSEYS